ncbi:Signal transduction histidine kinase [Sinomicrobium oceani]|uniref:histidine kinase n=1 Tax=Sinomicrobium oceani TaxID=1150368 RepID=A0A1K1RBR2_9FLAO|nr:HAMP domain-containing sensor histidine kinase [Sinomicrobium oceani]SFW69243.1 Signal transduction histidine kinase [Sinomicrobium oceani]
MKLLNKISLWFIGVVLLITPISMYIGLLNIKKAMDQAEINRMTAANDQAAVLLKAGNTDSQFTQGRPILIRKINAPLPENRVQIEESYKHTDENGKKECLIRVNSYYQIAGQNYQISSYDYVTKADEILSGMLHSIFWKMLLVILSLLLCARILSRYIFTPFRHTMKAIKHFSIKEKTPLRLQHTNTKEFRELNIFLEKMTDKAIEDYTSVKEFSENASHELQTPLAVLRSKMELLTETRIDASQAGLIEEMYKAIDKLSLINRSLLFLTKLENHEFDTSELLDFRISCQEVLHTYEERTALKKLQVTTVFPDQVPLKIHPVLAEILLSNLFSNAIRHNNENGHIKISLTRDRLIMQNTGTPPAIPTEELFMRFKKGDQCNSGIGLGLSIVKQICQLHHFTVTYTYNKGWHTLSIYFNKHTENKEALPEKQEEDLHIPAAVS